MGAGAANGNAANGNGSGAGDDGSDGNSDGYGLGPPGLGPTMGFNAANAGFNPAGFVGVPGVSSVAPASPTGFGTFGGGVSVSPGTAFGNFGGNSGGLGGGITGSVSGVNGFGGNNGYGGVTGVNGFGGQSGYGQGGNNGFGGSVGYGQGGGGGGGQGGVSGFGGGGQSGGGSTGGNAGGVGPGGHGNGLYGGGAQSVNDALNAQLEGLTSPVNLNNQYRLALAAMMGITGHQIANVNSAPVGAVTVSQLAPPQLRQAMIAAQINHPAIAFNAAALSHMANMGFPSLGIAHGPSGLYGYGASAPPGSNVGTATIGFNHPGVTNNVASNNLGFPPGFPSVPSAQALGFPAYGMNATALAPAPAMAAQTQAPALSAALASNYGGYGRQPMPGVTDYGAEGRPIFSAPQANPALSNFVNNLASALSSVGHGGH